MSYIPSKTWALQLSPSNSPKDAAALHPGLRPPSPGGVDDAIAAILSVLVEEAARELRGLANLSAVSAERTNMEIELRSLFHALRRPTSMELARLLELSSNPALATEWRDLHALVMGLTLVLLASLVGDVSSAERARMATRGITIVTDVWSSSRAEDVRARRAELLVRIDEALERSTQKGVS